MKFYFLKDDFNAMLEIIKKLEDQIRQLGKDQAVASSQSTEIFGHDDACQESIFQDRRIVIARLHKFKQVVDNVCVIEPCQICHSIGIGSIVELSDGSILQVGSYEVLANYKIENISYNSPLGRCLMNKKIDDKIECFGNKFTIVKIG